MFLETVSAEVGVFATKFILLTDRFKVARNTDFVVQPRHTAGKVAKVVTALVIRKITHRLSHRTRVVVLVLDLPARDHNGEIAAHSIRIGKLF